MPFSGMAASSKVVDLRNLLAERFPQSINSPVTRLATGLTVIDDAISGGLPKSAITELISPNVSAGSALLIHSLLWKAHRDRYFLALVDGRDSFDLSASGGLGNSPLRNLLWVRCTKAVDAVKAADFLLRDGNFPLVILDLVLNAAEEFRKIPQTNWYRLQRLVEAVPTALLVLTRRSLISSAQLKLSLDNAWTLADLERNNVFSRLRVGVIRVHGGRQQIAGAS